MQGLIDISPSLNERISNALDTIRPYLEADGGDMKIIGLTEDMTLQIELLGACSSCKMSTMTLKAGVEQAILKAVPEIKSVEAFNHMDEE